jgi:hypothetical protein
LKAVSRKKDCQLSTTELTEHKQVSRGHPQQGGQIDIHIAVLKLTAYLTEVTQDFPQP